MPVVVVGNLTVGGVGKTPLVIWLVERLVEAGYLPGVVSRGYGGGRLLSPNEVTSVSDPSVVGDEAVLVAMRTGRPVYVHPDRYSAGLALLQNHDCNVIVADDGLQHYALARDVEIIVIDGDRRFGNGHALPAGPLREPTTRAQEADFLVCRGIGLPGENSMRVHGEYAVRLINPAERRALADFCDRDLVAMAGIGNPDQFFALLTSKKLRFESWSFPDHHRFSIQDLPQDGRTVLMTEKDAVKCRPFARSEDWYVPVAAELSSEFCVNILNLIKVKIDGQKAA